MKKIMEVYGELVLGLVVLVLLLVLLMTFFTDGTVSGMVEESVDAILGNAAAYGAHMEETAPEAVWTGDKLPVGRELELFSYINIKTATLADWTTASNALTADFSDFELMVAAIHKVSGAPEVIIYDPVSGKCRITSAGVCQVDMMVTDKEKRTSSVSLCMIAE